MQSAPAWGLSWQQSEGLLWGAVGAVFQGEWQPWNERGDVSSCAGGRDPWSCVLPPQEGGIGAPGMWGISITGLQEGQHGCCNVRNLKFSEAVPLWNASPGP